MTALVRLLEKAEDLIFDPANWMKGGNDPSDRKWCAVGALHHVAAFEDVMKIRIIEAEMFYLLPDDFDNVVEFNDHPDTTHEDILSLYDETIQVILDNEHNTTR